MGPHFVGTIYNTAAVNGLMSSKHKKKKKTFWIFFYY